MTQPRNILVVDDDAGMRKTLRRILTAKGFQVQLASTGEEAVALAAVSPPDGILMDIKMPGIDGVEAYRRIRTGCPSAFVIFMSAYTSLAREAEAEGAVAVLGKPLDPARLCTILAEAAVSRPILIVDDDAEFLGSLQRVLETNGLQVRTALSAEEALTVYAKEPRCIVLLDIKLDGCTGLDVLRAAHEVNPEVCGFLMSGRADMEQVMLEGSLIGSRGQFKKPLDLDRLLSSIRDHMGDCA